MDFIWWGIYAPWGFLHFWVEDENGSRGFYEYASPCDTDATCVFYLEEEICFGMHGYWEVWTRGPNGEMFDTDMAYFETPYYRKDEDDDPPEEIPDLPSNDCSTKPDKVELTGPARKDGEIVKVAEGDIVDLK